MITQISQLEGFLRHPKYIKKQNGGACPNQNRVSMTFPKGLSAAQYGLNFTGAATKSRTIEYSDYDGDYKYALTDEIFANAEDFKRDGDFGGCYLFQDHVIFGKEKGSIVEVQERKHNNYGDVIGLNPRFSAYIDDDGNLVKLKVIKKVTREEKIEAQKAQERKEAYTLALQGRLHEAIEMSKDLGEKTDIFEKLDITKDGAFRHHYTAYNLSYGRTNYEEGKAAIEKEADSKLEKANEVAERNLPDFYKRNRELKRALTLGLSEHLRDRRLSKNKDNYINEVTNRRDSSIDALLNSELQKIESKEIEIKDSQKINSKLRRLQTKKERVKEVLDEKLNSRILASYENDNIKVPNCVMMVGPNPYIVQEFSKWIAISTDSDFVIVPSSISNEKMQSNLMKELELAEENWDENHKRTVIFVEGMEKLLNPELNSARNIAGMKDMMQYADEDCHATIVFHTFDSNKLDPGTMAPHRVGLSIDVPITYSDTKII